MEKESTQQVSSRLPNHYSLTNADLDMWNFVPPPPEDSTPPPVNDQQNMTYNTGTTFQTDPFNDRQDQQKHCTIPRPNHLWKPWSPNRRLSASTEQLSPSRARNHHLIDLNSTFSIDQNGNSNNSGTIESTKDKIMELFKTVKGKVTTNTISGRSNSLSTNALMTNSGFNFHANPIYHNNHGGFNNDAYEINFGDNNNGMPNQNNVNQYASLYWPCTTNQTSAITACPASSLAHPTQQPVMITSSSLPAASPLSPMAPNSFITNHYVNQVNNAHLYQNCMVDQQKLIEKIRSFSLNHNNPKPQSHNQFVSDEKVPPRAVEPVLQPTQVGPSTPEDPQQIINLFDPLVPSLEAAHKKDKKETSPVSEQPKYINFESNSSKQKEDDITNNNDPKTTKSSVVGETLPRRSLSVEHPNAILESFKVETRNTFNKEVNEYCEHLKSLYMTCFASKSTSNQENNSGLVYSPRIDIDYRSRRNHGNQSDKLYLYGASNLGKSGSDFGRTNSFQSEPDEDDLITIDVRFHALVYANITGHIPEKSNVVDFVRLLDSNYQWFSMIYRVNLGETVEVLISNVIYAFPQSDREVHTGNFLLKLYSINEFLQPDTTLASYVYVQNCKKNNKDIILELVDHTAPEFWRPFLRCDLDTKRILNDFMYEEVLPKKFVHNFHGYTAEQLNTLIDELVLSYTTIVSAFHDIVYVKQHPKLFENLLEKISDLNWFLSGVQTCNLLDCIENLKKNYGFVKNYSGEDRKSSYSIEKILALFEDSFLSLVQEFIRIIKMYSETFPVCFKLPNKLNSHIQKAMTFDDDDNSKFITMKRRRKVEISQITDLFTIKIDMCSKLYGKWCQKYSDFSILVNLFHGFNLLQTRVSERSKPDTISGKHRTMTRLMFNQSLEFDILTYMLPRETRIEFILVGYRNYNKGEAETLATTFFYLYDQDEILLNGSHLLPWTEMESSVSLNISINSLNNNNDNELSEMFRELLEDNHLVSHNLDPAAPTLVVYVSENLATNVDYCFPTIKECQEPISLDFVIPFEEPDGAGGDDSLYGFHGYNTNRLSSAVIQILQKNPIERLTSKERSIIWNERNTVQEFPGSILKIMKSPPSWSCHDLSSVYGLLKKLDSGPLSRVFHTKIEALQMMSADYPDKMVRRTVVKWLNSISVDELCDYLPQLVQSLRFETSIDSYLIWLLFEFSLISARFCHYFYWQLKSCLNDRTFGPRCQIYMNSLLILCGERTREQFRQQSDICEQFSNISNEIKQAPKDSRSVSLRSQLQKVDEQLRSNPISLPLSPSLFVNALEINQCSYFNSNSLPLKLVFYGAPPYRIRESPGSLTVSNTRLQSIYESKRCRHKIIFKCGDDLRKDMLVMQIISIINRVWLRSGLDLRLITFGVLNTSDRTGMIEMVSRANTLREIQLEHGLAGNFKHHTIATWLKRNNNNEFDYKMAIENFVHSCAGYLVITYLLGICDRHNDNIMVTTNGKLFHIDFGKFFGDAQMMAGIKRDRVPFVFTADMAFVINEGGSPSKNYQFFIDLCCRCFILVRQHGDFLLALMAMMIRSGVDYLSADTIQYFHKALMPNLTESQAKVEFTRLIEKAVGSLSTQLNFFIHSIAQSLSGSNNSGSVQDDTPTPGTSNYVVSFPSNDSTIVNDSVDATTSRPTEEDDSDLCNFSFTRCRGSEALHGRITHLEIVNFRFFVPEKNEKIYFYKVKVDRRNSPENFVYRSFKEFLELHDKLSKTFPLVKFYSLKRSPMLNRASRHEISAQRTRELQMFLKNLLGMASEIAHSDIVYTFFGSILRDQEYTEIETVSAHSSLSITSPMPTSSTVLRRQPRIKLDISYRDGTGLNVLVLHARNLDNDRVSAPDTYVKLYLRPDQSKSTKRKTSIKTKSAHPIFMENLQYNEPFQSLAYKILEVSVWESDMTGNKSLGQVEIPLSQIDIKAGSNEQWYDLHSVNKSSST